MKFIDFLKQIEEETTAGDIATVDQKFPETEQNIIRHDLNLKGVSKTVIPSKEHHNMT